MIKINSHRKTKSDVQDHTPEFEKSELGCDSHGTSLNGPQTLGDIEDGIPGGPEIKDVCKNPVSLKYHVVMQSKQLSHW